MKRISLLLMLAGVFVLGARRVGFWLTLSEPLQKADAVVVLGGQLPYRALEAAEVFNAGWANEVWVTQAYSTELAALRQMHIDFVPEHEWSRRVLLRQKVPNAAIQFLPESVNTCEELTAVLNRLRAAQKQRVILVSSKPHTRRVRATWEALSDGEHEAIVRYANLDPFQAGSWWRSSRDVLAVARELGGLLNVRLGFPLETRRDPPLGSPVAPDISPKNSPLSGSK